MHNKLTRTSLRALMNELARSARRDRKYRIFLVGGGTAVLEGWRKSTIDADLYTEQDEIFRDIQAIKERLEINVEFARPEDFVPPLSESENRHVFIRTVGNVSFYHYDPYAQLLSKIIRGFTRDLTDAKAFLERGMVDPATFSALVRAIPEKVYAKYPTLSAKTVRETVDAFLSDYK